MKKADILVVEDEAIVGREIKISLENMGFKVISVVGTGEKAIEKAGQDHPDIILMDIRLKGRMDGIEAAGQIRDRFDIPVIFLTACADEEKLKRAGLTMPFGYILKPFTDRDLMVTVQMGLYTAEINAERRRTEKLLQKAHDELEQRVKERTEELSLANSQLLREMEIRALAEKNRKKTNRELMFLNRMIRQVTAGPSFDHVIKSVIEGIDEILNPDMAILFIRKDDQLLPVLKNGHDQYTLCDDEPFVHRIGECLCGLAAKEGNPQYCMDIWKDDRCVREECRKTGYHSFAALPLLAREKVIGVLGLGALKNHDFTDRKIFLETLADEIAIGLQNALLLEKLKRHEELFRIAAESASDLIYEWDLETDMMKSFGDIEKMFGYKAEQVETVHPGDFVMVHPEDRPRVRELAEFQKKTGNPVCLEFRTRKKDGTCRNWSLRGGAAFDEQGKPSRLVGVCTDITEKKESETKIVQSREMLQAVFDGILDPLMMVDKDMRILVINAAGARYYSTEPEKILNRPCYQGMMKKESPCGGCRIPYSVMKEKPVTFERKGLMNPERIERVVTYPVIKPSVGGRTIVRISDITEEKKIQASLARADRLASLGQLSGGIAHEIRNPLEGIKLFVDILSDETRYERSEYEQELFNDINLNIRRINDIIKRVLTFARPDQASLETLNLNELVLETLKLFDTRLRKLNIRKKLSLEESLSLVNGDAVALQQVVVNLVSNAVDAMDGGGTLTIETFNSESSFFKNRAVSGIKIKDTGMGIRPEEKDSIFNPFYTTKKTGTGLGLAISHQIVERHGGAVTFNSEPGQGALFVIELPAVN